MKKTARLVKKAFLRHYCALRKTQKGLKPRRFLRDYFKKFQTKNKYLPRNALRKKIRQLLPKTKSAKKLRKKLAALK